MSHKATNWAFEQPEKFRDMLPSELVCLLALADCHNPAAGCFPSHDYIARATNLSPRSVRDQIRKLRDRGLISWEAQRADGKQSSSRYSLAFEKDFRRQILPPATGGNDEPPQAANIDSFSRQNLPPNPVIENRNKNRNPREGAGDDEDFGNFWNKWEPTRRPENRHYVLTLWRKLPPEDRSSAVNTMPAYDRFCALRKIKPAMITYLRDRIFAELDGGPPLDADGDFRINSSRPEWSEWLGEFRRTGGQRAVDTIVRLGYCAVKTRWPAVRAVKAAS